MDPDLLFTLFGVACLIAGCVAVYRTWRQRNPRHREFVGDFHTLEIRLDRKPASVWGRHQGLDYAVTSWEVTEAGPEGDVRSVGLMIRLEVDLEDAAPRGLSLTREFLGDGADLDLGDPKFDDIAKVAGPEVFLRAALGSEERRTLERDVLSSGGGLKEGRLRVEFRGVHGGGDWMVGRIRRILDLASSLTLKPADVPPRLLHQATADPDFGVARECARLLLDRFGDTPEATEALERLRSHQDPELRLLALSRGSVEDLDAIRALACSQRVGGEARVRGLEAWLRLAPAERRGEAETELLRLVRDLSGVDTAGVVAAFGLLQRRGSRACIPALDVLAKEGELPRSEHRACEKALALVRARLDSGHAGGLAVVAEEESRGGLSLEGRARGRLTIKN